VEQVQNNETEPPDQHDTTPPPSDNRTGQGTAGQQTSPPTQQETVPDETVRADEEPWLEITFQTDEDGLDRIPLELEGKTWVYQPPSADNGITLTDNQIRGENSIFVFSFPGYGTYPLRFLFKDTSIGLEWEGLVRVILQPGEDTAETDRDPAGNETVPHGAGYDESAPLEDRIAWALNHDDVPLLTELSRLYLAVPSPDPGLLDLLFKTVNEAGGDLALQMAILNRLLDVPGLNRDMLARVYFELAQLYERPGYLRDMKKAYEYYEFVYTEFPVTVYADRSHDRMVYLERHYLQVR
jgi:hypothetical protein